MTSNFFRKYLATICAAFALTPSAFSQIIADLRVNDEPDTSAFIARDPSLHVFSPERFLVTWADNRRDDYTSWANFFDGQARPLTNDFSILGGEIVLPETEQDYTVIGHEVEPTANVLLDHWAGYRQRYRATQPLAPRVEIDRFLFPLDQYGDVGTDSGLRRTRWGAAYIVNFIGTLVVRKLNHAFEDIGSSQSLFYEAAKDFTLSAAPDGSCAWCIFRVTFPGGPRVPSGLYLMKIDSTSVPSDLRLVLADTSYRNRNATKLSPMYTQALNDSTLLHLFAKNDSLHVLRWDTKNFVLDQQRHLLVRTAWPEVENKTITPYSLLASIAQQGRRKLLLGYIERGTQEAKSVWRCVVLVYTLRANGILAISPQLVVLEEKFQITQRGEVLWNTQNDLYLPATRYPRNYMLRLGNNGALSTTPLGNLPNGANQTWPAILPEDDKIFWVSWLAGHRGNGSVYRGRRVEGSGQPAAQAQELPGREGFFLQDGKLFVTNQRVTTDSTRIQVWEVASNRLQREFARRSFYAARLLCKINEERFFLFQRDADKARLEVFDVEGVKRDSLELPSPSSSYQEMQAEQLPDGRYWLHTNAFYLWNPNTRQLSAPVAIPLESIAWPVSADRILSVKLSYPTFTTTIARFTLRDTSGQILVAERMLTNDGNTLPIAVKPLPQGHFLILYQQYPNYYAQAFKSDFTPVQNPFAPFPRATQKASRPLLETLKERVVFAMSDVRESSVGRDVYVSVFETQKLLTTTVDETPSPALPNGFVLHRLSPNPVRFDQTLRVRFEMARRNTVALRIYNVLGQLVQSWPEQHFELGQHTVHLSMTAMPAGIYFLQATSTGHAALEKFALVH